MKLVYLTVKKYPGNTADHHYVRNLAYAFQNELGTDFTFVAWDTEPAALSGLNLVSVAVPRFLKKTFAFFFWIPWFYFKKVKPSRQAGEQVSFFSNDFNLLTLLVIWKKFFRLPITIVVDWHMLTSSWKSKFIASNANYSITTSNRLRDSILRVVPTARVQTVYGGVELKEYTLKANVSDLRTKLGLPQDAYLIGYVGLFMTMGMEKGILTMIDALLYLGPKYTMVFVGGKTHEIERYKAYAESKGVVKQCVFVPIQPFDKVVEYQSALDTLVIPYPDQPHYRDFGFPMKIYEYMASGKPIIYSNLEIMAEVLAPYATAFKPEDATDLARAVRDVASDKAAEVQKKAELASRVVLDLDWKKKAQMILNIIQK